MVKAPPFSAARWDLALAFVFLSLGVAGLNTVIDPAFWSRLDLGARVKISTSLVIPTSGAVRHRASDSTSWFDLGQASRGVAPGDLVFTGSDGLATLSLGDGSQVELGPNTLIVVGDSHSGDWKSRAYQLLTRVERSFLPFELKEGRVTVKLDQSSRSIGLKAAETTYRLRSGTGSARVSIAWDPKARETVKFSASSEAISITTDGTNQVVALPARPHEPLSPSAGATLIRPPRSTDPFGETLASVSFQWKPAPSGSKLVLELRGKQDQRLLVNPGQTERELQLPSGAFEWRLIAGTDSELSNATAWTPFSVAVLARPSGLTPETGASLWTGEKSSAQVELGWSRPARGLRTELELWRPGPTPDFKRLDGHPEGFSLELAPGDYRWHARHRAADGQVSAWSEELSFTVRAGARPAIPTAPQAAPAVPVTAPKPKPDKNRVTRHLEIEPRISQISPATREGAPAQPVALEGLSSDGTTRLGQELNLFEIPVQLTWKAVPGALGYRVALFTARGDHVRDARVATPTYKLVVRSAEELAFSYQIIAELRAGAQVMSKLIPFQIRLSPPVLKRPADRATHSRAAAVLLTWERTSLTQGYEFQLASDPAFNQLIKTAVRTDNAQALRADRPGTYYWRVRSLCFRKWSEWSEVRSFVIR